MSPEALSDVHSLFDGALEDLNRGAGGLQGLMTKFGDDIDPQMAARVWAALNELNAAMLGLTCDRHADHGMACVPYNGVLICTECAEQLTYVPGPDLDRAYDDAVGR